MIPGSERSSGEGNGSPFQYPCLENPMDRGACQDIVHGAAKESDTTEQLNNKHAGNKVRLFCEILFWLPCGFLSISQFKILHHAETDLGPFAAMLAPGYTSPQATQYIKIQYWTKNNRVQAQLGQNYRENIQRDQKNQLPILKSLEKKQDVGSKNRILSIPPPTHTPPPQG